MSKKMHPVKSQNVKRMKRRRRRREQAPTGLGAIQEPQRRLPQADPQLTAVAVQSGAGRLQASVMQVQEQIHQAHSNQQIQRLVAQLQPDQQPTTVVERNDFWGNKLGWNMQVDSIVAFLQTQGALPPLQSPVPELFAEGVQEYQRQQGLDSDGIIGPNTWRHLRRQLHGSPKSSEEASQTNDRKERRKARRLNRLERIMARIYQDHGAFLQQKSDELGIDVADAAAFLKVESGGSGFSPQTNLMKIRFENHVFYRLWGKNNLAQFRQHFQFNAKKHWLNHLFRADPSGQFEPVHSDQDREQEVLAFARTLDDELALQSISMGSAQVMGFNFELAGYESASEMFEDMSESIDAQNQGLFAYIQNKRKGIIVQALQAKNYTLAARYYNGKGKEALYGNRIKEASECYQRVLDKQQENKSSP